MQNQKDRYIPPFILDNPLRSVFYSPNRIISRFHNYLKSDYTVVDLGSGPGFFTVILAKIVSYGIVYAVDPDKRAIERLRRKVSELKLNNVIPIEAKAQKIDDIKDNTVDFIFSNLMLCCTVDHEGALKEMRRILKKDGLIYISVTKTFLGRDNKSVDKKEWGKILEEFTVLKSGESLTERWALVKT